MPKNKTQPKLGNAPEMRERLGSQDFGEVTPDSTLIGTVELHHVFLDTGLGDDSQSFMAASLGRLTK